MKTPKISVVIPTHNRPELLRRLLESVARQTLPASEVIVVDDQSSNPGIYRSLIQEFKRRLRGLKYLRNRVNRGQPYSRNRGILAAAHPLIALSDDDDEWMPRKLEKQAAFFQKQWNQVDMVSTWLLSKNDQDRVIWRHKPSLTGNDLRKLLSDISGSLPIVSATLIKRECLLKAGLFDETFPSSEDWDLWIRLQRLGCRCATARGFLTIQHVQKAGVSSALNRCRKSYIMLAAKHFWLFWRVNPVIFLHLAWYMTGIKLGLRKKAGWLLVK